MTKLRHLFLVACLAGCTQIPLGTAARLAGMSPVTADPAAIAIALDLPEGIAVREGGARMLLGARRGDTGVESNQHYTLERQLAYGPGGNDVYRIAPADLDALRRQQALIRGWQSEPGSDTRGTLSVSLGACLTGDGPAEGATASVRIRTEAGGVFHPLLTDVPVDSILDQIDPRGLPACDE